MKKIILGGKYSHLLCCVDDEDYDIVNEFNWYGKKDHNTFYAKTNCLNGDKRTTISMHRFILGLNFGDSIKVDHKDRNGLNNQRYNLRKCTHQQNLCNQVSHKNSSSRYKGVTWNKWHKKWQAQLGNGRKYHLGYHKSEEAAAKAYDKKAKEMFGDFACLNFKENNHG